MAKKSFKDKTRFSADQFEFLRSLARRDDSLGKVVNLGVWISATALKKSAQLAYRLLRFIQKRKANSSCTAPDNSTVFSEPLTAKATTVGDGVLIVGEFSVPGCKFYRVDQKLKMLEHLGVRANAVNWRETEACIQAMQYHSAVIFYRTPMNEKTALVRNEAKRLNMPVFYEIDDLVFDREEYTKNSNLQDLSNHERSSLLDGADQYCQMLKACEHAIASTLTLGSYMQKYCNGYIYIINNAIDQSLIQLSQEAPCLASRPDLVTIGYGSGTMTHDHDFSIAADAVLAMLKKYDHVRLVIHGHLQLPASFHDFTDKIMTIPFLDRTDYYRSLRQFDINIIPLESTVFNDAKSNIKYLEASCFSVPSVVSPAKSFDCCVQNKNALVARTPQDWQNALAYLIENPDDRKLLGQNACNTVMNRYDYRQIAKEQLLPLIKEQLSSKQKSASKRILFVNVLYKPFGLGGATVVVEELIRQFGSEPGYQPYVFTGFFDDGSSHSRHDQLVRYEVDETPVFGIHLPEITSLEKEYHNPAYRLLFNEVLDFIKPDLVHFHATQKLGANLTESCLEKQIPYVITLHDCWWLCERQFMINRNGEYCQQDPVDLRVCATTCVADPSFSYKRYQYLHRVLMQADLVLAPSNFQRELYLSHGLDPEKTLVNENGVLTPKETFSHRQDTAVLRFAYLGGKCHHKGYFMIKQVFEALNSENYELLLVDVHRKTGIRKISASSLKIKGKLTVCDGFEQNDIDAFYQTIDVLLFPSLGKESFGLSVREAIARNIWVIATDCGGPAEAIEDGINGNLVPMGDRQALSQAIRELIDDPQTVKTYQQIAQNQVRSFKEQAKELQSFYETII